MPEERKLATMLFADVVGSSAIGEARDPEVVRAALGRMFDAASEVIRSHGGTVEKFIGDAVMAVFGVPTAHDDDADRAVRAAFAIRERSTEFAVRIGINTGEVVADTSREGQFLVTGGAVNAAARIQQAAGPGEILVGSLTHRVTSAGVRYGPARRVAAKGVGDIDIFPAEGIDSVVPEQHRGVPGLRAPLIGRDKELRLLHDTLARAAQDGAPHLLTIYGPPGVGKSRLVSEFASAIAAPVRTGRCLPYGEGITYYPLQLILRQDAGTSLADPRVVALDKLGSAVRGAVPAEEADVVQARVAVLAGLADADALSDVAREDLGPELRWGLRRYLERRAADGPLVLVFEDLHWAEPKLLDLIEHLAEAARAPLYLVCLARPDFREARPTWGAAARNATVLSLAPLSGDDTRRLIAELLAIDDLSEDVRSEVVSRAEGNPLYVEEFLRALMESGRLERHGGRWRVVGEGAIQVPPTLTGLITARLDRVSSEVKQLLQRGSLAGRLFSISALAALGGEAPSAELLRDAVRRDLLVEADERTVGEGTVFRFKHALIREIAYGSLPKSERSRLHDRYGRWLESSLADRRAEIVDVVAHHADQAFALAHELGLPDAGALGGRAVGLLLEARRTAADRDDIAGARGYARRAARITDDIEVPVAQRFEARAHAAVARLRSEPSPESAAYADLIIEEGRTLGPTRALALLLGNKSDYVASGPAGDIPSAQRIAADALATARAADEPDLVASALRGLGIYSAWAGDLDASERHLTEALAFAEERQIMRELPWILSWVAHAALQRGQFSQFVALRMRGAALSLSRGSRLGQLGAARNAGQVALFLGDHTTAIERNRSGLAIARDLALPEMIAAAAWGLGEALLARGDAAEARDVLSEPIRIFELRRNYGWLPEVQARAARAHLALGDLPAAKDLSAAALGTVLAYDHQAIALARAVAAEVAEATGDVDGAERLFAASLVAVPPAFGYELAQTRTAFARYLIRRRRTREAREVLEAVRDFYSDPAAVRRRAEIDDLLRRCDEVPA